MGRLRAVAVLSAVLSGFLVLAVALYSAASPPVRIQVRLALVEAIDDAGRFPFSPGGSHGTERSSTGSSVWTARS